MAKYNSPDDLIKIIKNLERRLKRVERTSVSVAGGEDSNATHQPLNLNLSAISVLFTRIYGRGILEMNDAPSTRGYLGLGDMSVQSPSNVSIGGGTITGITDLTVSDGGTGASNAADARQNLGVPSRTDPTFTGIATAPTYRATQDAFNYGYYHQRLNENYPTFGEIGGALIWGPGSAPPDIALYRSAINELSLGAGDHLKTDEPYHAQHVATKSYVDYSSSGAKYATIKNWSVFMGGAASFLSGRKYLATSSHSMATSAVALSSAAADLFYFDDADYLTSATSSGTMKMSMKAEIAVGKTRPFTTGNTLKIGLYPVTLGVRTNSHTNPLGLGSIAANWKSLNGTTPVQDDTQTLPTELGGAVGRSIKTPLVNATDGVDGESIAVAPSSYVTIGVWVKAAVSGQSMRVAICERSSGDTLLRDTLRTDYGTSGSWEFKSVSGQIGADCNYVRLRVYQNGAATRDLYVVGGIVEIDRTTTFAVSEYFPTYSQLASGDTEFTGTIHASTSQFPAGPNKIPYRIGTVVSGSEVTFTYPSANTIARAITSDFTIPSDGYYVIGAIASEAQIANSAIGITGSLSIRRSP